MSAVAITVLLVALERLAEVAWAAHNTKALLAKGACEVGRAHYPLFIALHSAWLAAILLTAPFGGVVEWLALAIFIAMQPLRVWVLLTLGGRWTTRILIMPEAPLVRAGPYRYVRHPNYMIVICEIAALPIAFGEWGVALVFTILNGLLLGWRIKVEEAALAPMRGLASPS
jgi:methyltransferase